MTSVEAMGCIPALSVRDPGEVLITVTEMATLLLSVHNVTKEV